MLKIERIETIPLRLPVSTPLIESGGVFSQFNHVLIRIHADNGVVGHGEVEAYPSFERLGVETPEGVVAVLKDHLSPCLIGENPRDITRIWKKMDREVEGYLRVKAGLDIALYDLLGRHLGVPAHTFLGGRVRDDYLVEGVGYGISLDEPHKVAQVARKAVADGYRQLEIKAGDPDPRQDLERLRLVREAIGPEIPIKIDFNSNGAGDAKAVIRVIRQMEELGIQWVEQPAPYWDIDSLIRIRNAVGVPIVVDETVESVHDLIRVIKAGAADVVHIKPTVKGGLTMARKLASIAEAAGMGVIPGSSAPTGIGIAAVQAFIACLATYTGGPHGAPLDTLVDDIVLDPIPRGSTRIPIPDRPGLGVELDMEKVDRYRSD